MAIESEQVGMVVTTVLVRLARKECFRCVATVKSMARLKTADVSYNFSGSFNF